MVYLWCAVVVPTFQAEVLEYQVVQWLCAGDRSYSEVHLRGTPEGSHLVAQLAAPHLARLLLAWGGRCS